MICPSFSFPPINSVDAASHTESGSHPRLSSLVQSDCLTISMLGKEHVPSQDEDGPPEQRQGALISPSTRLLLENRQSVQALTTLGSSRKASAQAIPCRGFFCAGAARLRSGGGRRTGKRTVAHPLEGLSPPSADYPEPPWPEHLFQRFRGQYQNTCSTRPAGRTLGRKSSLLSPVSRAESPRLLKGPTSRNHLEPPSGITRPKPV